MNGKRDLRSDVSRTGAVLLGLVALGWLGTTATAADWPTLRGNPQRTGFVQTTLTPPFRLAWVRHFDGERLGTDMEPIVGDGAVFVATHQGQLYALEADTGLPRWRFTAGGPFLQSPAFANGRVVAPCADGHVYALDAHSGRLQWSFAGDRGGFSASPTIAGGRVFIGSRAGSFFALDLTSGRPGWRREIGVPFRQTAAFADGRVFVTGEDLRVRCFDAATGQVPWVSAQLAGQTARDYYPVIVKSAGRTYVIVRTNPVINMAQRMARDRHFLCQRIAVDDDDWRRVDTWIRSPRAEGNPELWREEQTAIARYEREYPNAQTFFTLEATTGKEAGTAPVLWTAGCQGVPAPPDVLPDGRLLTLYRTVYGHWSFGVAPLVALGILDLPQNHIRLLPFVGGVQPPWDTFWGTADESQNLVVANDLALIVHQDTLSAFDLRTHRLFPIRGERDTFGGFHNLPWALNEWHGPARGGVAVVGQRIFWLVGSRVLCLVAGEPSMTAEDKAVESAALPVHRGSNARSLSKHQVREALAAAVSEVLSRRWAPLFVEPGLAGRQFFFANNADLFEALARAYPHLPTSLQERVNLRLAEEWSQRPPYTKSAWLPLDQGARRESFGVPADLLTRAGNEQLPHPFGNLYAISLYARRCDEKAR
ncbi:MAG: PQQ-binding-like beta-propeller repeat protein, partial [Verrucomicrobia bacterium]|nr:PQQ-binding-like beta-propeller repeat protein [Verrucomicrobiota bacterium]